MKITAIMDSPKGLEGCTGPLVSGILEAVQNGGAETQLLSLKDLLSGLESMKSPDMMGAELLIGMFSGDEAGGKVKAEYDRRKNEDKKEKDI